MTDVIKIAALNRNSITTQTRGGMLENYIRRRELDILFLQEITSMDSVNMRGYKTYYSIGAHMRGTAKMARKEFHLTQYHHIAHWKRDCCRLQRNPTGKNLRPLRNVKED